MLVMYLSLIHIYKGTSTSCNANINADQFEKVCIIDDEAEQMLKSAFESMGTVSYTHLDVYKRQILCL